MPRRLILLGAVGATVAVFCASRLAGAAPPDAPAQDSSLYLESDREAAKVLEAARAAARAGRWRQAIDHYQQLAELEPAEGAQPLVPSPADPSVHIPIQEQAALELAALPRPAIELYRRAHDAAARRLYERAVARRDPRLLGRVARRYLATSWGDDALLARGTLAFDRGEPTRALAAWRRAAEACPRPGLAPSALRVRLWLALRAAGRHGEAEAMARELAARHGDDALSLGGRTVRVSEVLERPLQLPAPPPLAHWPALGGDATHARVPRELEGVGRRLARFSMPHPAVDDADRGRFLGRGLPVPCPTHPTARGKRVFLTNEATVVCLDLGSGEVVWMYPDAPEPPPAVALAEAVHAASWGAGRVVVRLADSVAAFHPATGKLLWRHRFAPPEPHAEPEAEEEAGPAAVGAKSVLLASPPSLGGDKVVFALTLLGDEARSRVVALDAATGREIWDTFVCSRSVPAFLALGATPSPPAIDGSTVYHGSNLGAAAALDLETGAVRWVQRYPSFPRYLRRALVERRRRWANNPPMAAGGFLFLAPQDAARLFAIDPATGAVAWSAPRHGARYLVGGCGDRLFLIGHDAVALHGETGRRLWKTPLPQASAARPLATPSRLYVPTRRGILRIEAADGAASTAHLWRPDERPGNLAAAAGTLLVAAPDRLQVFEDWARTRQRIAAHREEHPRDPWAPLALGIHEADCGRPAQALAHFRAALSLAQAAKDAAAIVRTRRRLYDCLLAMGSEGDMEALAEARRHAADPGQAAHARLLEARLHERRGDWPQAVAAYQGLIAQTPQARLQPQERLTVAARALATAAIDRLIDDHGREVYAAQEADARALLAQADGGAALEEVVRRFPNSAAAETALLRLLDRPAAKDGGAEPLALARLLAPSAASEARATLEEAIEAWARESPTAGPGLSRRWQAPTRIAYTRVRLLDLPRAPGGLLYFAMARFSYRGGHDYERLECRRQDTGQLAWRRDVEDWNGEARLAGDLLVLPAFDAVMALDAASGTLRWSHRFAEPAAIRPPPPAGDLFERPRAHREPLRVVALAADAQRLFVGQASGTASALSLETGKLLWSRQVEGDSLLAHGLAVHESTLWVCAENPPAAHGFDAETGERRHSVALRGPDPRITDRPVHDAAGGRLYVVLGDRSLRALDLAGGRELWTYRAPFAIRQVLVPHDGRRCYLVPDGFAPNAEILSLDPQTGEVHCRRSFPAGSLADAALAAHALYVSEKNVDRDLVVHALQLGDLRQRWRSVPLPLFKPSPLAAGPRHVALSGHRDGSDMAVVLDAASGKVAADLEPAGARRLAAGLAGETLCLSTDRGIYAFAPAQPERLDQRIALLSRRLEAGDRSALGELANALYQRGQEARGVALLAEALGDESLPLETYQALKDQLDALRESGAARRPPVLLTTRFSLPPQVDGAINEAWRADRAAALDGPAHVDEVQARRPEETRWSSPSDLSATLYTGWDEQRFYFAVDVRDDIQRTYTSQGTTWVGDGLIICIDCDNDGGYGYSFDGRDILLTLALTHKDEQQDEDDEEPSGEYRVRRKDDNSGTIYEVAIPWKYLDLAPKPGLRFGFNISVIDDDGDHTAKALSWTPGMFLDRSRALMIRGFTPAYFGDVLLTGPEPGPRPVWTPEPKAQRPQRVWIRRLR
ncbi:MAG: PQQ-binding-like beta-propeller repeat protein [Candidatus Brocadiia bacterium]